MLLFLILKYKDIHPLENQDVKADLRHNPSIHNCMAFQKRRFLYLFFLVGYLSLNFIAGLCRKMVGITPSSTGRFSFLDSFDGGSGTLACGIKESVKLYINNIRTTHVELARKKAVEASLADARSQGIESNAAAKQAEKDGDKAAKLADKKANRILGPIVSSGWDIFEVIYHEGYVTEGVLRGAGTLCGTYIIGFLGEEKFGRLGYLVGSTLGSWIGGKIGHMAYEVVNGIHFVLRLGRTE